jgi:hypothetical protein
MEKVVDTTTSVQVQLSNNARYFRSATTTRRSTSVSLGHDQKCDSVNLFSSDQRDEPEFEVESEVKRGHDTQCVLRNSPITHLVHPLPQTLI